VNIKVDNDNRFASFFAKKWLQTIIVFREKNDVIIVFSQKLNFSDNREATIALSLCGFLPPLWLLPLLWPFVPSQPYVLSSA
jgi:hypothetical protein